MTIHNKALLIRGLRRDFDGGKKVLRGIDLEVGFGESVALLGPNGAGKTTLLRILSTLISPTEGDAWVAGHSVVSSSKAARSCLGWVPATDGGFFPRFTGRENLILFASMARLSRAETERRISRHLELEPLRQAVDTPFYLCSAGMKQALGLCRALLLEPRLLLLDEPTRSLDSEAARRIRTYLTSRLRDTAILFSTHSQDEAAALGSRIVTLKEGILA